jgi:hypothetical protein
MRHCNYDRDFIPDSGGIGHNRDLEIDRIKIVIVLREYLRDRQ